MLTIPESHRDLLSAEQEDKRDSQQRECARDSDNPPCARSRHGKRLGSAPTPCAPMSSYCHMCGSVQKTWRLAGTPAWTILTDVCFWH